MLNKKIVKLLIIETRIFVPVKTQKDVANNIKCYLELLLPIGKSIESVKEILRDNGEV